jgi:hypothetical protein
MRIIYRTKLRITALYIITLFLNYITSFTYNGNYVINKESHIKFLMQF